MSVVYSKEALYSCAISHAVRSQNSVDIKKNIVLLYSPHSTFFFRGWSVHKTRAKLDSKLATSEAWDSMGQLPTYLSTSVLQHPFCRSQYPGWRFWVDRSYGCQLTAWYKDVNCSLAPFLANNYSVTKRLWRGTITCSLVPRSLIQKKKKNGLVSTVCACATIPRKTRGSCVIHKWFA